MFEEVFQYLSFCEAAGNDFLPEPSVEVAKILFDLSEIRQQVFCGFFDKEILFFDLPVVEHIHFAAPDIFYFLFDFFLLRFQDLDPEGIVFFGFAGEFLQAFE